jgi:tetratricopeptide (TPR) repeat protein
MVLTHTIQPILSLRLFRIVLSFAMIWLIVFCGCQPSPSKKAESARGNTKKIKLNDFLIPVYPTAAEQLAYARSRVADIREKEAALRLVLSRFSQNIHACALARLDLAYLTLGDDYRLADQTAYRQALAQYHQIIRTYADRPGVCAKAYWYMGWIYTDLLGETDNGMAMYRKVIEQYPSQPVTIESPVSWLRLMYPEIPEKTLATHDKQRYSWAILSLLEVVKNDKNPTRCRRALMQLSALKSAGPAFGLALLSVLRFEKLDIDDTVIRIAHEYIQQSTANKALIRDIETTLAQRHLKDAAK